MMENRNLFVILLFIHYLITYFLFFGRGGGVINRRSCHTCVNAVKSVKSMLSFTFSKAFMVGWSGVFDTPGLSATAN